MEKQPLVYPNDGLTFRSIRDRLASLDLYPKTLEDFRIKTLGGATGLFGFTLSSFGLYSNYRFSFSHYSNLSVMLNYCNFISTRTELLPNSLRARGVDDRHLQRSEAEDII